ncbi:DUF1566 domain-containing protein [Chromobacterium haemolyticum]|uniref:DUF1566 domain-containing protein n=1 Tax=Chromobacterium haemolyticum TaxID=394935 RepID=A0ABS3GSM4_9NEIS|nr:DUF1566 domain-containing protein [Chromobacterium haemolyticum]MBK0415803.1 DUF1566 domain-containing protein [Chromobacterium haemolyticum]MBO0417248.1 DUF1566 domain-containing protein [Chromobacterium haemolyticum]MBO0500328.1 DUF1566 domain-containing protein [Chromobacterium haemolyticum]OQS36275.1 hypothetical protein B0T40_10600 [Chromobacterium haemolyticum]
MHSRLAFPFILAGSLAVAACSGGPAAQPIRTGVFVDSPVAGLDYDSGSHAGKTTASGEFHYLDGETVVFRIGKLELGRSLGAAQITPLQLAGSQNSADPKVLRQVQLLLTLDQDGNPDNGIQIVAETSARFDHSQSLEQAGDLQTLLNQVGIVRHLASAQHAASHFQRSLAALHAQPPSPRFVPLAKADGAPLSGSAERAGCVKDKQTGLTWEVKAERGLRGQSHRYYASASVNQQQLAHCEEKQTDCQLAIYVQEVRQQKLCGFDDQTAGGDRGWRLPTERELKTLLDWSQRDKALGLPALDRYAFPDATATFYWSSTSYSEDRMVVVAFDDTHRSLASISLGPDQAARVRLVRGPRLADEPLLHGMAKSLPADVSVQSDKPSALRVTGRPL